MSIDQKSLLELIEYIEQKSLFKLAEYIERFTFSNSLCDGSELVFEAIEEIASERCTELMQTGYSKKFNDWLGVEMRANYLKFLIVNNMLEHETKLNDQLKSNSQSEFECEQSIKEEENKFKSVLDSLVYLLKNLA